jgi:hypothetical protein
MPPSEHLFDTEVMDREPVEHAPDQWRDDFNGHYINQTGRPDIPVTVHVRWF